ncbi:MAG: hypothetical protein CMIDDMOC_00390 [Sodalis sp. Fle]|nr:MAG: hypothetical protein CMIDDMOC_00390 [Sodalis sp. Fle]
MCGKWARIYLLKLDWFEETISPGWILSILRIACQHFIQHWLCRITETNQHFKYSDKG